MTKPLVIFHGPGCMDGAASALAAWLKFGEDAEYRPAQYGDAAPTDEEVRGRDVYVLDFSYPRAELERMYGALCVGMAMGDGGECGQLVVLDHHKTAQTDLTGLPFCTFNMDKSGAVLAWEHFHVNAFTPSACEEHVKRGLVYAVPDCEDCDHAPQPPELFAYVQDRDLWRWELPHSREVSAALAAGGALTDFRKLIPIYEGWKAKETWSASTVTVPIQLRMDGAAILRAERLMVERVVASAEEVEIGYDFKISHVSLNADGGTGLGGSKRIVRALAATSAVLQSEVGEALALESARQGHDAVGAVYYRDGKAGKWRVSLRSRNNPGGFDGLDGLAAPDVSAVAKSFGGGGHAKAAGFECDELPWSRR